MAPDLTDLALFALLFMGTGVAKLLKRLFGQAAQCQASMGRLMRLLEEMIRGIHIIKIFSARSYILKKYYDSASRVNPSEYLQK